MTGIFRNMRAFSKLLDAPVSHEDRMLIQVNEQYEIQVIGQDAQRFFPPNQVVCNPHLIFCNTSLTPL